MWIEGGVGQVVGIWQIDRVDWTVFGVGFGLDLVRVFLFLDYEGVFKSRGNGSSFLYFT
jgi:hypothetical protein